MGTLLAPLFAWFFELVGNEAKAEIQRKKAAKAQRIRRKRKADKVRRAAAKELARAKAEAEKAYEWEEARRKKSRRVSKEVKERIERMRVDVVDDPYGSER